MAPTDKVIQIATVARDGEPVLVALTAAGLLWIGHFSDDKGGYVWADMALPPGCEATPRAAP